VSDGKILDYRGPFSMVISMMERYIHAALTGCIQMLGPFKLRGVIAQFTAALNLYRLFATHHGEVPENELDWAMHVLLDTLLRPSGLGTRPVDCPTDQAGFLWAFLSNDHYRISKDLSSLIAGFKFGFRCIGIHGARVRALGRDSHTQFYNDDLPHGEIEHDDSQPDSHMQELQENNVHVTHNSPEPNVETILAMVNDLNAEGTCDYIYVCASFMFTQISWTFPRTTLVKKP
jgi:hypothetical protein